MIHAVEIANVVAIVINLEIALGSSMGSDGQPDTKRAGLGITLALDHAAVGRERLVVHDDGAQIWLPLITRTPTPSSSDALRHTANTIEPARITASFSIGAGSGVDTRECYDLPFESPVGLLGSSAGVISHSSTPSTSNCIRSPR